MDFIEDDHRMRFEMTDVHFAMYSRESSDH